MSSAFCSVEAVAADNFQAQQYEGHRIFCTVEAPWGRSHRRELGMYFLCSRSNLWRVLWKILMDMPVRCLYSPCGSIAPYELGFWYFGVIWKNLCCLFTTSVQEFITLKKQAVLQICCSCIFLLANEKSNFRPLSGRKVIIALSLKKRMEWLNNLGHGKTAGKEVSEWGDNGEGLLIVRWKKPMEDIVYCLL